MKGATLVEAHREYLDYCMVYEQFKYFRALLMAQGEKVYGIVNVLIEIKRIKKFLEESGNIEKITDFLDTEYDKYNKIMSCDVEEWAAMQDDLIENEHFKEYNHFIDVDPIGYQPEDLEPERFNKIACEVLKRQGKQNQTKIDKLKESIFR